MAAIVACVLFLPSKSEPDTPEPPQKGLVAEVQETFKGKTDKAIEYAGVYDAVAYLIPKTDQSPLNFTKQVAKAFKTLDLGVSGMGKIAQTHLSKFEDLKEWTTESREEFSEAVKELADACRKAAK